MRISDWSSDVCSSDLRIDVGGPDPDLVRPRRSGRGAHLGQGASRCRRADRRGGAAADGSRAAGRGAERLDRTSVVLGKSVSVRVALGGRRIIQTQKYITEVVHYKTTTQQH